jgi:DNA-binding winged helix-turn-helix (wHTH) protein|tara:strand:- start:1806 stop:2063 length:258 start_codon:yes stop_codon:yes gene_type:complete
LEPKQIEVFELLCENKDKPVGRKEIYKKLWAGEEVSPIQIEQQMNKLREGLDKLGFEKEIITTHKRTQLSEGAYTFHSNLASFLK